MAPRRAVGDRTRIAVQSRNPVQKRRETEKNWSSIAATKQERANMEEQDEKDGECGRWPAIIPRAPILKRPEAGTMPQPPGNALRNEAPSTPSLKGQHIPRAIIAASYNDPSR